MNLPELRAIIVDDEPPARRALLDLLEQHRHVSVIGEANCLSSAIELCRDLRPNLVFLDIHLGTESGFSLLPKLDPIPAVIFVTAYEEFAVRAFEVNAVDYLLKPVLPERLAHALERIVHTPQSAYAEKLLESDMIYLQSTGGLRMVFLTEIGGIEADQNYSIVRLKDGPSMMIRRGMSDWEKLLPKQLFFRPHRSLIVNVHAVRRLSMKANHEVDVEIMGFSEPAHLGRRAGARLRKALREPNLL